MIQGFLCIEGKRPPCVGVRGPGWFLARCSGLGEGPGLTRGGDQGARQGLGGRSQATVGPTALHPPTFSVGLLSRRQLAPATRLARRVAVSGHSGPRVITCTAAECVGHWGPQVWGPLVFSPCLLLLQGHHTLDSRPTVF